MVSRSQFATNARAAREERPNIEAVYVGALGGIMRRQRRRVDARIGTLRRGALLDVPVLTGGRPEHDPDPDVPATLRSEDLVLGGLAAELAAIMGAAIAAQTRVVGEILMGDEWELNPMGVHVAQAQARRLGYIGDSLRDRFDGVLRAAAGNTFDALQDAMSSLWDGLAGWYSDRVAGDEAQTTINGAIAAGAAWGGFANTRKIWVTMEDDAVRHEHRLAHGQIVATDEPFIVGDEPLWYPGDPDGSTWNIINCFPAETVVAAGAIERVWRRWYSGPLVTVRTRAGRVLTGTPNHPVLTASGWQALATLDLGQDLVGDALDIEWTGGSDPDVEQPVARIGDLFDALAARGARGRRMRAGLVDLHGEIPEHDVDRVDADGDLVLGIQTARPQLGEQRQLRSADLVTPSECARLASTSDRLVGVGSASPGGVRSSGPSSSRSGASTTCLHPVRLGTAADRSAGLQERSPDEVPGAAELLGERLLGLTCPVALDEIIDVEVTAYSGHVYNLQTATGAYLAAGMVVHNCRCEHFIIDESGALIEADQAVLDEAAAMDMEGNDGGTLGYSGRMTFEWNEDAHPRGPDGRFGDGEGSSASGSDRETRAGWNVQTREDYHEHLVQGYIAAGKDRASAEERATYDIERRGRAGLGDPIAFERNGARVEIDPRVKITDKKQEEVLRTLAGLHDLYPGRGARSMDIPREAMVKGLARGAAYGLTRVGSGHIVIAPSAAKPAGQKGFEESTSRGFFQREGQGRSVTEYTITHEFGHTIDRGPGNRSDATQRARSTRSPPVRATDARTRRRRAAGAIAGPRRTPSRSPRGISRAGRPTTRSPGPSPIPRAGRYRRRPAMPTFTLDIYDGESMAEVIDLDWADLPLSMVVNYAMAGDHDARDWLARQSAAEQLGDAHTPAPAEHADDPAHLRASGATFEYDEEQHPRDEHGRWTSDGSGGPAPAWHDLLRPDGAGYDLDRAIATRAALREQNVHLMRGLAAVQTEWQMGKIRDAAAGKNIRDKDLKAQGLAVRDAIRESPPHDGELHRGIALKGTADEILARFEPGTTHDWNITSFSTERGVADEFAAFAQQYRLGDTQVHITVEPGMRGVPMERISEVERYYHQHEIVGAGRYEVAQSHKDETGVHVTVRQIGTL